MQETAVRLLVLYSSTMGVMAGAMEAPPKAHTWEAYAMPSTAARERRKMTSAFPLPFKYHMNLSVRWSLKMHLELCWPGCQRNILLRFPISAI